MNGIGIAPTALAHGSEFRPTEMVGERGEAVAQTMNTDFGQSVFGAQFVYEGIHGGGVCGYQSACFAFNYII